MLQNEALNIMKMGYNVFLTGEAGSGKTYLLNRYIKFLKSKNISVAITASTGIAATHIDGVTLDSWSGVGIRDQFTNRDFKELGNKHHLKKRLQSAKVLIVDEISMISGNRFDLVDEILQFIRGNHFPFGGLQVILSGDLFQLPPFSKDRTNPNFIFKSKAWTNLNLRICYLHEAKRQNDNQLLEILNSIRHNQVTDKTKRLLLNTVNNSESTKSIITKLYTHNIDVDAINQKELDKNKNESHFFNMTLLGPDQMTTMLRRTCLAPERLELKKGALVMFVRNNFEKGYVNGTLGKIVDFNHNEDPIVETLNRVRIIVEPATWTISEDNKIIAQITQIPLRLAWAITVHKSQGMTLDAAEIDLSKSFVEGMGYVALSRVKSIKGLRLLGFNEMALHVNSEISELDKYLIKLSTETVQNLKKLDYLRRFIRRWKFMYKLTSQA